jgi:beta-ureidopropionase / N-carbamoyl-L-amino-acid hydrolase
MPEYIKTHKIGHAFVNTPATIGTHSSFLSLLNEFSQIGATDAGGIHRPEGTLANGQARNFLASWFAQRGHRVIVDGIGNMFGVIELRGPNAPIVMTGSHIDSQPDGGCLDGTYGVVAGCAAAETIVNAVRAGRLVPAANLCVAAWTNEEGARWQPSTLGSGTYVGDFDLDYALSRHDGDGVSVKDALAGIGWLGKDDAPPLPTAYVELHVECGPVLERRGLRFGVFERWWGCRKIELRIDGAPSHTGPTLMSERRDALYAAAQIIVAVRKLVDRADKDVMHTSVGRIEVFPNSPNVVPSRARLFIELRSADSGVIDAGFSELQRIMSETAQITQTSMTIERDEYRKPGRFSASLAALAHKTASDLSIESFSLDTIPAHDAVRLAPFTPSIVIAVPSVGGICHSPLERTEPADLTLGLDVLTDMLRKLIETGGTLAHKQASFSEKAGVGQR